MEKHFKRILFTRKQIEKKCKELAKWVNKTYENSNNLIIIGILKGSIPFISQLIKDVKINHKLDFMTVSSYRGKTSAHGTPKIVMDLASNISKKDILIVEDIVDTCKTLITITKLLATRKPNSMKTLTLIKKEKDQKVNFKVDKYGFKIPNVFVAGFGLDIKDKLRNLPYIGEFDLAFIDEY